MLEVFLLSGPRADTFGECKKSSSLNISFIVLLSHRLIFLISLSLLPLCSRERQGSSYRIGGTTVPAQYGIASKLSLQDSSSSSLDVPNPSSLWLPKSAIKSSSPGAVPPDASHLINSLLNVMPGPADAV